MWARLVFCFFVIAAAGAEHRAWQVGKQYDYKLSARTLAALHDVANEYNGVLLKAKLRVQPEDDQTLNARVVEAQQAEIHQSLPGGWDSQIDKRALSWKPLEHTQEPFQIVMENGVVRRLIVSSKVPTSEVNLIKGLVSQLQVDTKGENMIRQNEDDLPAEENPSGVYNVMEDAVTGKCEVQYDISELPKYQVQSRPEIVPMPQLAKNGQVIDVVKTSNFSNCANRPEYHFGLNGLGKFKPASAKMGQFFARSSISRVVLTGNVNKYTIQSAVTTHKTIISPALYNTQKGMVVSRTNMTLIKIESAQSAPQAPTNPIAHQSLVYKYESEAMKKLSREAREVEDQESSVEIAGAAKDFHKSLKRPSAQDEDVSFEQAAYLPEDLDQSVDMLLHPNYAFPEAMNKQKVYTNIVELAKQIGQELQSAEAIQSEATLAKFNVLAALVRSARTSELKRITQELYSKDAEEKTPAQVAAWKAFRDAVAEAGTGPALLTLKDWIMNDLVQGEEAAELIAALPRSARHPTNKYIQALFELATNQKVKQQQYLNTTAVLAFGDLVRLAQVDEKTMHSRYPSHIFGRLNPKEGQAVVRDYIPYFKNALKRAVQNHDSHRIQTYTHVLGNIAHPKIVDVFEPYLSGKVHMTNYQRQAMVHALDKLVESYPRIARAALLKIYQNVADAPQVRAIAVIYLMKTNPPAALLQRMAESVKDEQNPHIRSIVKTAIEAAAQLNAWDNWELKTHAKSAESMLNQTDSNAHLSQLHIKSNDVKNTPALSYFTSFATIGSQDSVLPRTIFMKLRQNLADLKFELQGFGVMTSSIEEIINSIGNKFEASKAWKKQHSTPYKTSHGFSIEDVLSEMNIARDHAEPIEANLLLRSLADKRFFTMDNQTIQQLPYEFQKVAEELRQGKSFNYTKLYNQYTVAMSFPTATGFPFFYSLSAPTLLSVGGKARVVMHPQPTADKIRVPETMNATLDIHVIASSKVQAQLGFVNPLTLNRYTAGLDKDMQIHVPVLAQVDVEVQKKQENRQQVEIRTRIQPSESDESFPIVNLCSKPYLAKQSLLKAAPQEQHAISVRKPFQTRFTVGQDLTGMAFRVEAATEMKFVDFASLYKNAKKHDFISAMTFFTNEDSIHNYNLKMSFDHEKSTAKSVELTAAFETHSKKTFDVRETYPKEDQDNLIQPLNAEVLRNTVSAASEDDTDAITPQTFKATPTNPARNLAKPQDKSANSQERRTEFLKKASKSIQDADAVVVDLSATFKGLSRAEFVATAAAAQSEVSDNTRVLLYLRKKSADQKEKQFAMAAESDVPRVPLSNFVSALKSQPDILVMTAIAFGEEIDSSASQIDAVAFLHRSRSQREHVRKSAMGKLCVEQMHKGNNHLPACQNATLEASKLNSYYLDIAYDRISEQVKNATYKAYSLARDFGWEFNTENLIGVQNQPKKIHLKARFEPNYQAVNVSIAAPQLNSHFENVRLNRWVRAAVVVHPTFSPVGMLAREALNRDQYPQCNIGQSAINTFSNKTFPVKMGRNWHAVLVSAYKKNSASQEYQDLVVLVRDTTSSEHQKEVIVLSGPNVIELTYARDFARVNVNGKTIKMSDKHTNVFSDGHDNAWAMLYGRPDGSVKIVLPIHKVKMLYDRTNLAISAGSQLREQMRGLCGKFNDVDADDFTVPRNCVVKHPKDFTASYIVRPTGNAANEQQQAKEAHCIPKMYNFGGQRRQSDDEYAPAQRRQSEESAESQESGRSSGCVSYKTKTVEHDGKMCFSKRPQPSCNSSCRPTQEIERNVEFVCIGDRDLASQYQRQIRSGSVPSQITRSSAAKKLSVKVPETCRM